MIAEKNKPVQHVTDDVHELTMHSHQGFMEAMSKAGIRGRLTMRRKGERGLYVGVKPLNAMQRGR